MGSRKMNKHDLFNDPKATRHHNDPAQEGPAGATAQSVSEDKQLQHGESDLLSISSGSGLDDIGAIRHQNRTLGKRSRASGRTDQRGADLFLDDANSSSDEVAEPAAERFDHRQPSNGLAGQSFTRDSKVSHILVYLGECNNRSTRNSSPSRHSAEAFSILASAMVSR
ncbi:unnamed protein product [Phytophthora fragariaefolia]|uniref:Unnamed protein product n=1 Tax=Phytophthora fragariaefolia TaxID=1490495 RepID=A0A9W6YAE4_9STRA|nr:unnamed protein product [Phytophthora fragariaefolia]